MREPDALGEPRRGAARLAIEAGAPLVPAAITGTDQLWLGPIPKPKKVSVAFGAPIRVEELEATPEAAAALLEGELWPEVETQFRGAPVATGRDRGGARGARPGRRGGGGAPAARAAEGAAGAAWGWARARRRAALRRGCRGLDRAAGAAQVADAAAR